MSLEENLVFGKELEGVKRKRSQTHVFAKFEPELKEKRESEGWQVDKELKNLIRMKKPKPIDEQFEDEVWILFASLGFKRMNCDRHFTFHYSASDPSLKKQIDVFAVDDETILFVECKCSFKGKKGDFLDDIQAIKGIREGLFAEARKHFPDRKPKYIFATKNYEVTDRDRDRMKDFSIQHFDEYAINYFSNLAKHLGSCARFQLLGHLFEGQKIRGMENRVPAIEGNMGGYTYYSFSIEPEKLLKIAYVLHRNEANSDMMPTYQRIIKKNRLKEIKDFINKGGFFPNSLLISIDTKGKKIVFDSASLQVESSNSRIGVLHLPQLYRSAYIVDGQHRLYGYAESNYVEKDTIPVVAFVNLKQEKQVELFMEINENQKSVSKNLQNTLNADLLWASDDWNKQRKALRLNIAQKLGELQASPFFGRIIIGDGNESSTTCCIKIDTINNALKSTKFLSRYSQGNIICESGTFDKGNNSATRNILLPFLIKCFNYFKENLPEEWDKGDGNQGVLSINNSVHALIRILNDVVNHLINTKSITPTNDSTDVIITEVEYYLAPLVSFFDSISDEQRKEIRTNYGSGGKAKVWRIYQKIISDSRSEFVPEGLSQWIRDNTKQFNSESYSMIQDIERIIKQDFAEKLSNRYKANWLAAGLPPKVYKQAHNAMGKRNYDNSVNGISKTVTIWDCVTLDNCKDIAIFGPNWKDLFEKPYTRPGEEKLPGGKIAKIEWLSKLHIIGSNNSTSHSISEEEYIFLKSLHSWLIK